MCPLLLLLIVALTSHVGRCKRLYDIPELQYLNESVDPCDNFYEFSCGNFKNVHPLPAQQQSWDHFAILQEEIHELAKDILNAKRTRNEPQALQKAKAFYTSCINSRTMEGQANGHHAQVEVLTKLNKWPAITADYDENEPKLSWTELARISADYGLTFLLSFSIIPALRDPDANVIYIQQDALSYPDASGVRSELPKLTTKYLFPFSENKQNDEQKAYLEFLKSIAFHMRNLTNERATDTQVTVQLEETIDFIMNVSKHGIIGNESIPTLNLETTVQELQNWTDTLFGEDFLDWITYLNIHVDESANAVTKHTKVFQTNSTFLYGLLNQYRLSSATQLKNYVIARLMTHMAPDSDRFMIEKWRNFTLRNDDTVYARDDYCVRKTLGYKGNMGFSLAVTYEYQAYHFNPNKMDKANSMASDVLYTFLDTVEESEWMDNKSKEKAVKKCNNLIMLVGYPEEIVEETSELSKYYDDMRVCSWDHFGNAQRLRAFGLAENLKSISSEKERHLWDQSPLEINAFYNRGNNRILLPISILNSVFFTGENLVLDYARLGSIIGHEITHGFDKFGKDYNASGSIEPNGWTSDTLNRFEERAACFGQQYYKYYIDEIAAYVDGNRTLNENIADNGGLRTAYKAWKKVMDNENIQMSSTNYTPEQLFFIGFGTMWCTEESEYYLKEMNKVGVYPPARFRVIGSVSNMPEFADAFQCPLGSNMNPEEKCYLW